MSEVPPPFTGVSEFGTAMATFLAAAPEVRGAIVTDAEGDPVDFAHHTAAITALDLQIAGAQTEQVTRRMQAWCTRNNLGTCTIWIEASHGCLLSTVPGDDYVLAALHNPTPSTSAHDLLARFADLRNNVRELLA